MPRRAKIPDFVRLRESADPTGPFAWAACYLNPDAHLRCERCGETFPMPLGSPPWFAAVLDAFGAAHRGCVPKAETEDTP